MRRAASRGQYLVDVDRYIGSMHVHNRSADGGGGGGAGAQDDGGAQRGARGRGLQYTATVLWQRHARTKRQAGAHLFVRGQ